jgi:hypothetical protein
MSHLLAHAPAHLAQTVYLIFLDLFPSSRARLRRRVGRGKVGASVWSIVTGYGVAEPEGTLDFFFLKKAFHTIYHFLKLALLTPYTPQNLGVTCSNIITINNRFKKIPIATVEATLHTLYAERAQPLLGDAQVDRMLAGYMRENKARHAKGGPIG